MSHYTLPVRPRTLRRLLAGIAASVLAAMLAAPQANADDATDQFLTDMRGNGFHGDYGDQSLLTSGSLACRYMDAGIPWYSVANTIWLNTDLNTVAAQQFVEISAKDLCPWHFGGDTTGTGTQSPPADAPQDFGPAEL